MPKIKVTIDQIGATAWTWTVHTRDGAPLACSGSDGEFGCFATMDRAMVDVVRWFASALARKIA